MYAYAPYTDTTLYPTFDISTVPNVKWFCLGFIVADENKNPSWGGYYPVGSNFYTDIMSKVRASGGDLICSFGGAAGNELAVVNKDIDALYEKYKKVVDTYKFESIDFDIEGGAIGDREANSRRAHAILKLQNKFPNLKISLTLPVGTSGLDQDALDIVAETPCDLINIMAMDYGNQKDMGKAAIDAANATRKQTGKSIGITVMNGKNDTGEVFTLDDAKELKAFQKKTEWVKRVGIWAIERDRGEDGDLNWSSQVDQKPYEYTCILK
jgi:chitinase